MMIHCPSVAKSLRRRSRFAVVLVAQLVAVAGLAFVCCPSTAHASEAQFKQDLDELTKNPHRLAGTPEGHAAADYIERRLREIGIDQVLTQQFPLWQTKVRTCELRIGGKTISLKPMRPNVVANPVTDSDGVQGPLIYAGQGRLEDYGDTDPEGAIVVLDYASYDNWDTAFALGAEAVIFLGDQSPSTTNSKPMHAGVPATLIRFFAKQDPKTGKVQGVDLTRNRKKVTLKSQVTWERSHRDAQGNWSYLGRNIVGIIRGSKPAFASSSDRPEALVLAAKFDSFGNVPQLSPGARGAANVAALLEAAQWIQANRPRRDVILMFLDNQSRGQQGVHELYEALFMEDSQDEALAGSTQRETSLTRGALEVLNEQGLDFKANDPSSDYLLKTLTDVGDWQADDLGRKLQLRRLRWRAAAEGQAPPQEEQERLKAKASARNRRWDAIQRALHNSRPQTFVERQQRYADGQFTDYETGNFKEQKRAELREKAPKILDEVKVLRQRTARRFKQRLEELALDRRMDRQRRELRSALTRDEELEWITAHVSYNLGDASGVWGPVVGGWIEDVFPWNSAGQGVDSSGFYTRFLGAIRHVAGPNPKKRGIAPTSLREHNFGDTFIPGSYVNSGSVAGEYRIYNFAMMTGYDARLRDGHPADTVENLDWKRLRSQALEATKLLQELADGPGLSQPRRFQKSARNKYPSFSDGKVDGNFAKLQVSGGLSETRPASGALMAIWPGSNSTGSGVFNTLKNALDTPAFEPIGYRVVDNNGRFPIKGMPKGVGKNVMTLGAMFDDQGRIRAITADETIATEFTKAIRVDLFPARAYEFSWPVTYPTDPALLKILQAQSNAPFRATRTLAGQVGAHSAFFVSDQVTASKVKIFQRMGPVALGHFSQKNPSGTGVPFDEFTLPPRLAPIAARDLWQLNERRFQRLRDRGVTSADIERLHSQAQRLREQVQSSGEGAQGKPGEGQARDDGSAQGSPDRAGDLEGLGIWPFDHALGGSAKPPSPEAAKSIHGQTAQADSAEANARVAQNSDANRDATRDAKEAGQQSLAARVSAQRRSLGLSHRVYGPLMQSMNDLVNAIVVLLVLAIPFAFVMERLLFCSTSIYGRIAGFVVLFLITFTLLYFMHPGFAIATTPVIIFLAFAIILLSSLVIYLLARKFRVELQAMQGQSSGAHELAASRAGTLLAAVGMGMSTMRRRPTRTTLTAITVVMLTFTILCFASFSQKIGIRSVYEGPVAEDMPAGVLLRNLDYSEMPKATLGLLHGQAGDNGLIAAQYWLTPSPEQSSESRWSVTVVKPKSGKSVSLKALMGVDTQSIEQHRWPALANAISDQPADAEAAALRGNGVYLPPIARDLLELSKGDEVLVQGQPATFAGVLASSKFQRLRHIDGEPAIPVDFADPSSYMSQDASGGPQSEGEDPMIVDDVQRDFVHLSADQVGIVSNDLARRAGAKLHLITMYPDQTIAPADLGRETAKTVVSPVWAAGREGVEKMLMTQLTEVAGGMQLFVPLLLGGLIIFGTLLGSISDREREIYTFSALGLSPGHVGVLFFAEAAVYAVVGGMGGQLLAQVVALVATELSQAGLINPISINYSSTNSIFAMAVVMATVMISAIYPAYRASKSANPGLARTWKMPKPEGDDLKLVFPFTVSAYDITGIVAFLAEHFRRHDDAGLGSFAASDVEIGRDENGELQLAAHTALAPFDLGVTQRLTLTAVPSEIPGVDEVAVHAHRLSGANGDWFRSNRVFMKDLRRQFLIWRTLTSEMIESYRMVTLETLGEAADSEDEMDHTQPQAQPVGA